VNSLLPLSGPPESQERLDALVLPWLPDTTASNLRLRLVEAEAETSWVGTFAVGVVDHPVGTRLAMTQTGRPYLAAEPVAVDSMRSSRGVDLTGELGASDGVFFVGDMGDTVSFVIPLVAGKEMSGGGGIGIDGWKEEEGGGKQARSEETETFDEPGIGIEVFHPIAHEWVPYATYRARDEWGIEVVDLAAAPQLSSIRMRLVWTGPVPIDSIRLFREVTGEVSIRVAPPVQAVHSTLGDVRPMLLQNDEARVALMQGEQIDLLFELPRNVPGSARDLVALTRGSYRPQAIGKSGSAKRIPPAFFVQPVRPNPVAGAMHVNFGLPRPAPVALRVFDLSGRLVHTVETGSLPAGYHELTWDGRASDGRTVAAGVYFYRLEAGRNHRSGRVVILR